jgi:hypothetical protein
MLVLYEKGPHLALALGPLKCEERAGPSIREFENELAWHACSHVKARRVPCAKLHRRTYMEQCAGSRDDEAYTDRIQTPPTYTSVAQLGSTSHGDE